MANIKTPDGGFYIDDNQFIVDYQKNIVKIKGEIGPDGDYLTLDGGMMNPDAVISGDDTLEISLASGNKSAVIGLSAEGVTISNETNEVPTASVRVIENVIEVKADSATMTINGSGIDIAGTKVTGVGSITGQDGAEVTIETDLDMNNHKITNVTDPVANEDVANKKYVDNNKPVAATTMAAGLVKQMTSIEDSSGATDTALEAKFNELLAALRTAGMLSD